MKLDIRKIPTSGTYTQEENVVLKDEFNNNDFFNKCNLCNVKIYASSYYERMIRVDFDISTSLNILDKESGDTFNKDFRIKDTVYYTNDEELADSDDIDKIIILNKNMIIDLDLDIYSLIVCNMPLNIDK